MAFLPQNPNEIPVPSQDSADNSYIQDVVGNKTDTHAGNSLYSVSETINEHFHTPSNVYPTLANGVVVTAGAAWTLGAFVEIVPASTITSDFDIHFISIEAISANDVYEIVLYYGESDIECGRVRVTKNANLDSTFNAPVLTGTAAHSVLPANSKIRAKVASSAGSNNVTISIFYHTY